MIVTGDIYIRANDCTSDFAYSNTGGMMAYCRSKLGNLWFSAELQRRYPRPEVITVHPGVVASGLGGESTGFAGVMRRLIMVDTETGAQTPLWCATQPGLERGGYYHNTLGRVTLNASDPAADAQRAAAFWCRMEALSSGF